MNKEEFISISQYIGARVPIWTQGAGSNVSIKTKNTRDTHSNEVVLLIKASGFRLDAISNENGIAKVRLNEFVKRLHEISNLADVGKEIYYSEALDTYSLKEKNLGRPSMETGFHCLLPKEIVMHFHSLTAILMIDFYKKNWNNFSIWFENNIPGNWKIVNAEKPGWVLSEIIRKDPNYEIFLLENHGVIIQSNNKSFLHEWEKFEIKFCKTWGFSDLVPLYHQDNCLQLAKLKYQHLIIPLKIYFPDTAVFLDKLKNFLLDTPSEKNSVVWKLKDTAWHEEKNIAEIWLATQILFCLNPKLNQLPESISNTIATLPSELIRKKILSQGV